MQTTELQTLKADLFRALAHPARIRVLESKPLALVMGAGRSLSA